MTAATVTLTDFLLARIADDEAAVLRAYPDGEQGEWFTEKERPDAGYGTEVSHVCRRSPVPDRGFYRITGPFLSSEAEHVARFASPPRVLAECEAKRKHIEHYLIWAEPDKDGHQRHDTWAEATRFELSLVLYGMARVYADHPDYREDWAT